MTHEMKSVQISLLEINIRLVPVDNYMIFHAILKFHRPAERRKSWFIKEVD